MADTNKTLSRAIYPGTFDPVTNGHLSLIERACHLFDELLVAVSRNAGKHPLLSFDERLDLMESSLTLQDYSCRVKVISFEACWPTWFGSGKQSPSSGGCGPSPISSMNSRWPS